MHLLAILTQVISSLVLGHRIDVVPAPGETAIIIISLALATQTVSIKGGNIGGRGGVRIEKGKKKHGLSRDFCYSREYSVKNLLEEASLADVLACPLSRPADRLEDARLAVLLPPSGSKTQDEIRGRRAGRATRVVYHYHPRYRRRARQEKEREGECRRSIR